MPQGLKKILFLVLMVFISYSQLAAQTEGEADQGGEPEAAAGVESVEEAEGGDSEAEASEDEAVAEEGEPVVEPAKKKVNVDFILGGGNLVYYDKNRLSSFYADYLGFLKLPLRGLFSFNIPTGLSGIGIEFTGMDINGSASTVKIPFGGGIKVMKYSRGVDGNQIEYTGGEFGEWWDEGYWETQNQRKVEGKTYIEQEYDVAWAEWGLEWNQNIRPKKSAGSDINVFLAYRGIFQQWLRDNNEQSRQLLFETDFPDRERSILNKLIAQVSYSHTSTPQQTFTHGLSNNIYTSFRFETAPGVMNPNLDGHWSQKEDRRGNPLFKYRDENNILDEQRTTSLAASEEDFGVGGKMFKELTPTADYYYLNFRFGGRRALFDVAPDRATNVFSGFITAGASINWTSELGWDGYIPLAIRSGQPRFKTGANVKLTLNLPEISIMDLKGWSTPRANINFSRIEDAIFGFLNRVGMNYSRHQFNRMAFLRPWVEFGMNADYYRDYDGNFRNFWAERDYQFTNDNREGFNLYAYANLKVRVLDLLTIRVGFNVRFGDMALLYNIGTE